MDSPIRRIDTHQHFWRYNETDYTWMTDDMGGLREDHLPPRIADELQKQNIEGTVVVQARHDTRENDFLLGLSREAGFIRGIVGWADMTTDPTETLERLEAVPEFKGLRYVLADAPQLMEDDRFLESLRKVAESELVFDLLVLTPQLEAAAAMIRRVPGLKVAVNHAGKPDMGPGGFDTWYRGMATIAEIETTWCKVSGLVSEAPGGDWKNRDYRPWTDALLELFSSRRLMFGSDWPTCTPTGAGYTDVIGVFEDCIADLSPSERGDVYNRTAIECYSLDPVEAG